MKRKKANNIGKLKLNQTIAAKLNLPSDVLLGAMIVTVIGSQEVMIENYKGIIEYNSNCITIQGKHCSVCLTGSNFFIKYFTNDDMKIVGNIKSIEYND